MSSKYSTPLELDTIKILFVGDPHFKTNNIENIPLFQARIVNIINTNKLDFVVVAGDLLDNHDRLDVEPYNLALQFIDALRTLVKTFVLVGNHDYKNNQQFLTDHHWMNALKHWNNVEIVDSVVEYQIVCGLFEAKFLFVPYVPPGRFIEAIKTKVDQSNLKDYKAIFAHQEFYGCKMGPIQSTCGDKWDEALPMVVSGHIHNKQWSQKNIYYPGSAMQHAFGQSIENTVSILSFNPNELSYEEVDLKMPKLIIKYISVCDIMKPLKYENKKFRKYKLVVEGNQEELLIFKKNPRYKQLLDEGFKITLKIKNLIVQDTITTIANKKNFLDILYGKIEAEGDPELETIFKRFMQS